MADALSCQTSRPTPVSVGQPSRVRQLMTEICADPRIDPSSQEGVSLAAGREVRATVFGTAVAFKYTACVPSPTEQAL
jgi:hypothetical protein